MARKKRPEPRCYVYAVMSGVAVLYVGKGSGRCSNQSARRFGGVAQILEGGLTDEQAFVRERFWIAHLKPTENKVPGGNGGRCVPKPVLKKPRDLIEIERVGSRRYSARFLLSRLDEHNCERWGVSKVGLSRLREVADGPRC